MTRISAASSPTANKLGPVVLTVAFVVSAVLAPRSAAAEGAVDPCAATTARFVAAATATTLNALAACHEQQGKTASAWAEFLEAGAMAQREKRADVAASAKRRAKAVEPRLATIAVRVAPDSDIDGLEVTRDGIAIVRAAWGTAAPVDPGEHYVEATAPGKVTWRRTIVVRAGADAARAQSVEVGPLENAAPATAASAMLTSGAASSADADRAGDLAHPGQAQRRLGLVVAAVGLAGIGVGTYFGIRTLDKSDAARSACPSSPCSDRGAVDANDQAKSAATISTTALAAGGGLVLLGSLLFFMAASGSSTPAPAASAARRPSFDVAASPSFSGLRFGGAF